MTKLALVRALGQLEPHGHGGRIGRLGADGLLSEFWRLVISEVRAGRKVSVPGVGTFYQKRLKRRRGLDNDGNPITFPSSARLGFRASKHAKWRGK